MSFNPAYMKTTLTRVSQARANLWNRWINIYGQDCKLYSVFATNQLTIFGETSSLASRTTSILRIIPSFNANYAVMPFGPAGLVDEQNTGTQVKAYIRTIDNVNVGDFIEIAYEFAPGTMDKKYYKIDLVEVENPSYISISKKLTMSTFSMPISLIEKDEI